MDVRERAGHVGEHRGRKSFGAAAARGEHRHLRGRHLREGPNHRVDAVVGQRGDAVDGDHLRTGLVHRDDFPVVGRPQHEALVAAGARIVVQSQVELEAVARGQGLRKRAVQIDVGRLAPRDETKRLAQIQERIGTRPNAVAGPAGAGIRLDAPGAEAAAAVRAVGPAAAVVRGRIHVHRSPRRPRPRQRAQDSNDRIRLFHGGSFS